jgi:hypothetical protein
MKLRKFVATTISEYLNEQELLNKKTFFARKSNHIKDDIKRNWSSWNFGEEGFKGTYSELEDYLNSSTDTNPVWISGFEIYPDDIKNFEFGELYNKYWVAIDNVNASGGLSGILLKSNTLNDAIIEANKRSDYFGDGDVFSSNDCKLVYSKDDIHIFEEK